MDMIGGFSGAKGILLYETQKDKAAYGYYENEQIVVKVGTIKEMKELQKSDNEQYRNNSHSHDYVVWGLMLIMLLVVIVAYFLKGLWLAFCLLIFCVLSYMSFIVVIFGWIPSYEPQAFQRFRKIHGAEHRVVKLMGKNKELTIAEMEKVSHIHPECGTAYSGMWFVFVSVFSYCLYHIFSLGIMRFLGYCGLTILLLGLNLFNPYTPFQFLQYPAVTKPTKKEMLLAIQTAKALRNTLAN